MTTVNSRARSRFPMTGNVVWADFLPSKDSAASDTDERFLASVKSLRARSAERLTMLRDLRKVEEKQFLGGDVA